MGSLSNLYISQSYQSLIHLATNNTASATLIDLQDGLGNSIGVSVNTGGDLFLSGSLTASLQQGYLYVGDADGKTYAFPTSSLVTNINTGSLVTTSSFNQYTASTDNRLNNLESTSASVNISISNLNSTTASQAISISNLNAYTQSNDQKWNNLGNQSGSWVSASITGSSVVDIFNTIADYQFTYTKGDGTQQTVTLNAPTQTDITSLNEFTASQLDINSGYNTFTQSANTQLTNLASSQSIDNAKWNTLGGQSGSWITESETGSFARYDVSNPWSANQTFTNISAISASFTYVQTTYETSSVIYSSGSNIFGDELTDTQTLSGSVKVQGSLTVNGIPVQTSSVDISSLNAFTASQETKNTTLENVTSSLQQFTQSADSRLDNLEAATSSYAISSSVAAVDAAQQSQINSLIAATGSYLTASVPLDSLNAFTASQELLNTTFATTASNTFTGIQTINSALQLGDGFITPVNIYANALTSGQLYIGSDLQILGTLTASLQEGYALVGDASNRTTLVATSSFGGTINTGSFATTGSNTFVGNQTISGSLFQSGSLIQNGISEISGTINITGSTTIKGTTRFENSSTTITGSLLISGSTTQIGNNLLVGTTTLSGSVFVSGNIEVTNGAYLITHNVKAAGSNGLQILANNNSVIASMGEGGGTQARFYGSLSANSFSASTINGLGNPLAFSTSVDSRLNNLEAATSSYVTSAITASSLVTASVNLNTITFTKGDASTFNITVNTGSGGSTTDISSLNQFTASQELLNTTFATTGSNTFTGVQNIENLLYIKENGNPLIYTQFSQDLLTNKLQISQAGASGIQLNGIDLNVGGTFTASLQEGYVWAGGAGNISTLVATSSFGGGGTTDISSLNAFTASQETKNTTLESVTSSLQSYTASQNTINTNVGLSASLYEAKFATIGTQSGSWGAGGSIDTGSFATTGSNVFTGIQTFADAGLNATSLVSTSGSLMLVAKSYNSSSAHMTASANLVNLIFKDNNNSGSAIITGSNNIIGNPSAPTADYRRYVSNGNIALFGTLPQLTSSMAFPVSMNGNFLQTNANNIIARGPVSSSTWTLAANFIQGTVNIGTVAFPANRLVSGLTLSTNTIPGSLAIFAHQNSLTSSLTVTANNINGTAQLFANSSSITFSNNIVLDNSLTWNNNYYSNSVGLGLPQANRNLFLGTSNTITTTGVAGAVAVAQQPNINNNIIGGTSNTLFINATNASTSTQLVSNIIYGNTLIVTGSSTFNGANIGSAFFGRYNANDGRRNSTAGTIFAVGTGTAAGSRKTGFLIDSGSNTFIEGTLNVSGSTILTGSIISVDNSSNATNTIIGLNALGMGSAGAQPLAVGNTISIAIGNGAMRFASGSSQNVAIGNNALLITTGSGNFALGSEAMANNTIGAGNIAIGQNALNANRTGNNNVVIGTNSGFKTSGSFNTFVGDSSGYNITGSQNTIIGRYQGSTGESFDNNIILADGNGTIEARFDGDWQFYDNVNVTGSLSVSSYTILSSVSSSLNFADDAAAAAGGVPLGGLYRTGNAIQIRLA